MVVKGRWELISHDRVVLASEVCPTRDHLLAEVRKIYREKIFRRKSLAIKTPGLIAESVSILSFKDGCENLAV